MKFTYQLTFWEHFRYYLLYLKARHIHFFMGVFLIILTLINIPYLFSPNDTLFIKSLMILYFMIKEVIIIAVSLILLIFIQTVIDKYYFKQIGKEIVCEIDEKGIRENTGEGIININWEDVSWIRLYKNIYFIKSKKFRLTGIGLSNMTVDEQIFIEAKKAIQLWGKDKIKCNKD